MKEPMKEILVTYQPDYRSDAVSCIISIPIAYYSAQERLDSIQKAIQTHYWNSLSATHKHGLEFEYYYTLPVLFISDLKF